MNGGRYFVDIRVSAAGVTLQAASTTQARPAILGGSKTRSIAFESWPKFDLTEEKALLEVLRSGKWYRGNGTCVKKFEEAYAALTGAKQSLACCNGSAAL